jgi:voltage-gated potassium channel
MSAFIRFFIAFFLLLLVVVVGTLGYMLIENWPLNDSLFMTIITITTVGFSEVHPLSETGRHFTIILLILSIATVGYSVTILFTYLFEGIMLKAMREFRMKRSIKRMKDHYIICGCGDVGREVALEFKRSKVRFLVIDRDPEKSELARDESILFLKGDAVDDEILLEANIEHARGVVSALPEDESNVFVVLTARQLNPRLTIVSQAEEQRTIRKLLKAGANRVISPSQIAGRRMASFILRPSVVNFLDVMVDSANVAMRVEEVTIETGSPLVNKNLREAGIGRHTGAIILGINGPDGKTKVNPSASTNLSTVPIRENDVLIAMGNEEQIGHLKSFVRHGT